MNNRLKRTLHADMHVDFYEYNLETMLVAKFECLGASAFRCFSGIASSTSICLFLLFAKHVDLLIPCETMCCEHFPVIDRAQANVEILTFRQCWICVEYESGIPLKGNLRNTSLGRKTYLEIHSHLPSWIWIYSDFPCISTMIWNI